ncbi:SMI1/KNR4 family protein [Streptomyces cyaneofuscatus]|uniref:SMI1/KNR4 family protein n=1 Tax=Streptomyces cyaneofuscatus TaxID=66883 RepID=UPI00342F4C18
MAPPESVTGAWLKTIDWLRANAPTSAATLNPPATDSDLHSLADSLQAPLPQGLETLLRINNGSGSPLLPDGGVFMDCKTTAQQYSRYVHIAEEGNDPDWWTPAWVPFAERPEGHEGFLLDTSHPACPVFSYTEADYPKPFAPSLAHFLTWFTRALIHGDNPYGEPFAGRVARVDDAALRWDWT